MLGRSKVRSLYGAIFFPVLLCFAGCGNYNQSIEDFIYYQTGTALPRGQARMVSPEAEPYPDGSFHIRSAAADLVVELDLENDRGYALRFDALNNGAVSEAVRAEQTAPDRVLIRIAGAKPGDVFRIVLQAGTANGYRSFGEIPLPVIYCDAPLSGARELSSFAFGSWPGTINESAKTVAVIVPDGTAISGIIPVATVSLGADYSPKEAWGSGVSGSAKTYTVTAEDGAAADYVVTVTIAAPVYHAAELLSFDFGSWPGTINESAKTVAVTVPYGTAISGIIPVAAVSPGADYSPKEAWGSGSTKTYTVTAADGTSADYVVTITVAAPVYSIVVSPSANGTITASPTGAAAGETVALTVSPDSGYGLKAGTLLVKETSSGAPMAVSESGGGAYSFVMPAADVTVTAEFAPTTSYAALRGITLYTSLKDAIDAAPAGSASSPDEITLLKSITLPEGAETTYTISKHIRLVSGDSGGNTITRKNSFTGSLFTVNSGASLTLDGSPNALVIDGDNVSANAALITVNGGMLNMYNGVTLRGNENTANGSGVRVVSGGSFTMSGGTISGNTTSGNGGGVYVNGNGSLFEMQGGIIGGSGLEKNTANNGGGVMVSNEASFIMTAGSITGNIATGSASSSGGGVDISAATFTMKAGSITGNTAVNGGGVGIIGISNLARFEMQGGSVTGNIASGNGGGVHISGSNSLFDMQGGTIGGSGTGQVNTAIRGNGVYVGDSGKFAMSGSASLLGQNGVHMSSNAGSVSVEGEATVDLIDQIYLETGKYVTLSGDLTGTAPTPRARIQLASFTSGITTKVLGGVGTLVQNNKAKFLLIISSGPYAGSYPGENYINNNGEIINIP